MRFNPIPTLSPAQEESFWNRVEVHQPAGCWHWTGYTSPSGYGIITFWAKGRFRAHRIAYTLLIGDIPEGMTLDHLCRNTHCVNPDHLEVVDEVANTLRSFGITGLNKRKTHCVHGHEFTPENTQYTAKNNRRCRTCQRELTRRYDVQSRLDKKRGLR